eukprot:1351671-Ditylum_brightwellii.AAC.1
MKPRYVIKLLLLATSSAKYTMWWQFCQARIMSLREGDSQSSGQQCASSKRGGGGVQKQPLCQSLNKRGGG